VRPPARPGEKILVLRKHPGWARPMLIEAQVWSHQGPWITYARRVVETGQLVPPTRLDVHGWRVHRNDEGIGWVRLDGSTEADLAFRAQCRLAGY
jgi:hypothetical protein